MRRAAGCTTPVPKFSAACTTRFSRRSRNLQRVPVSEASWLERPAGVGVAAELKWWREYAKWGTDNKVPDIMTEAFDWLARQMPDETGELSVCWNDARLSNAIFDDAGQIVGALDWEQACLCPAETDFAWWLATRRQMLEVSGLDLDPELPGFDSREQVIRRYEEMIGRPLVDLHWYEVFAMVRMGCCILRTQELLRSIGQGDHFLTRAPILPAWTVSGSRGLTRVKNQPRRVKEAFGCRVGRFDRRTPEGMRAGDTQPPRTTHAWWARLLDGRTGGDSFASRSTASG